MSVEETRERYVTYLSEDWLDAPLPVTRSPAGISGTRPPPAVTGRTPAAPTPRRRWGGIARA